LGVGQFADEEDPISPVGRSNVGSAPSAPPDAIPQRGKLPEYPEYGGFSAGQPEAENARWIFRQ
jgi:hypothetical protein